MSQNFKSSEYTVISNTDVPNKKRVAVFNNSEKKELMDYIIGEIYLSDMYSIDTLPITLVKETTIKNFHTRIGGFVNQHQTRTKKINIYFYNNAVCEFINGSSTKLKTR
ncbi:MAG: hypothetical protein J6Y07_04320 [Alphaproteobacteria bacterium]|nr:hypothetical protein [Alphaproteobacteria bacterium]